VSVPALNLARSATIVWRHKIVAAVLIALGLVGNTVFTLAQPAVYTSSAFVMLPVKADLRNQAVVATSVPVLAGALRAGHLGLSLDTLRKRVSSAPENVPKISITAVGPTAQQAERTANAVTRSFLSYVTSAQNPQGPQAAVLLQRAMTTTAKPRGTRVPQAAAAGALGGAFVALIAILAIWRDDRRLRTRDAVADSIGVPVIASVRAHCPASSADWEKLLTQCQPAAADAWQLRRALSGLGVAEESALDGGHPVAVLSVRGDRDALTLGPQLVAFAAAQGIPVALSLGRLGETKAAIALRAAAAGTRPALAAGAGDHALAPPPAVTVIVDANADAPGDAGYARAEVAVLAATAGVVTAEQLTRAVASAASAGVRLAGTVVINPYANDHTTGLLPQLARSGQQGRPTRLTSVVSGRLR
jgi:capsular polysaccharide biosynthesis protein